MKRALVLVPIVVLALSACVTAQQSLPTWNYPLLFWKKYPVERSLDYRPLETDLRRDEAVLAEMENNEETGLIGYLLFEDGKIVVDESDIPDEVQGDRILNGLLPSHSIGKSLVSYVTGHAICEGYITGIDEKLDGWATVEGTLFDGQRLRELLNMQAGDQRYVGEWQSPQIDNLLKKDTSINVNAGLLDTLLREHFQGTTPGQRVYNYSALTTNVIMNYVIHRTGDDWEGLLHRVFHEHVRVKDKVFFLQTVPQSAPEDGTGRYSFYATRYDYLRIALTLLEDWHSDSCIGDYLRLLHAQRIEKKDNIRRPIDVALFTASYGGQFHFDIFGLEPQRTIFGLSGFAGQQIVIDMDRRQVVVVNSLYRNYDWNAIVYRPMRD